MLNFLTTIPLILGYPAHIWLGLILALFLIIQITTGILMIKGKMQYLKIHRIVWILIALIALIHMYYGLGLWFFHFAIK